MPPKSHPNWARIVRDRQNIEFEFFATKIILGRLNNAFKQDPGKLDACITELHDFFVKNDGHPKAISDLNKIFK